MHTYPRLSANGVVSGSIITMSEEAVALGGVGPRHARRPEAADRWPADRSLRGHS
jgi:hypothetical protein